MFLIYIFVLLLDIFYVYNLVHFSEKLLEKYQFHYFITC